MLRSLITTFLLFVLVTFSFKELLLATPNFLTLQSRITQPNGQYLEVPSVNYRISITDPVGTCVVYQEDFSNVSMVGSKGLVTIKIGSGVRGYPVAATTMKDVFTNLSSPVFNCQAGGTYTAASSDQRKLVLQFNDGGGWQTVPGLEINSTPFAIESFSSQKLGLYPAADYVRLAQLSTCVGGEAVHFNGTNFTCVAVGGGSASSVAAAAGLVGAPSISFSGDTNTGFYSGAADTISISNNGSNTFNITNTALTSTTTGGANVTQINGTAAAPTFSFAGDADTGWYRPAADTLAASTAGAERMRVDSLGNVGIGTTIPASILHIAKDLGAAGDGIILQTATVSPQWYSPTITGRNSQGTVSAPTGTIDTSILLNLQGQGKSPGNIWENAGYIRILQDGASGWGDQPGRIEFGTTPDGTNSSLPRMSINNLGNVGIGTSAPGSNLAVNGGVAIGATYTGTAAPTNGLLVQGRTVLGVNTTDAGYLTVKRNTGANADENLFLDNNEFGAGKTSTVLFATGGSGRAILTGGQDAGTASFFSIGIGTPNVEKFRIDSNGNVGIGTAAPDAKLHVAGDVKLGNSSATCNATTEGSIRYNSASKKLEFCNGTTWTESGGISSCAAGFTLIGTSGSADAYCISTNEEATATWQAAATACYGKTPKAQLCDTKEWLTACISGETGLTNFTNANYEWTAENGLNFGYASAIGFGACSETSAFPVSDNNVYRCCYH